MSPKSRGRPPGRGRSRRPAAGRRPGGRLSGRGAEEITDCWFDDPLPGDRRSWAVPPGHGTYQGLELDQLDPDDEDERTFLLEAQHLDMEEALKRHEEMPGPDGEPVNPTLHVALHTMIANQLLSDDPPETWQTVQRLAGLGYDWHNVMHLIMGPVTDAVHGALSREAAVRPFGLRPAAGRTTRRLAAAGGTRPALRAGLLVLRSPFGGLPWSPFGGLPWSPFGGLDLAHDRPRPGSR